MDNNRAQRLEGAENTLETPNRREFLKAGAAVVAGAVVSTAGLAQKTLAEEVLHAAKYSETDFEDIPYRESELGIDYRTLADFPVSHMLSQGEAEWVQNAGEKYGERASVFWNRFAPLIGEGRVSESIVDGMKNYTPNMLLSFARLNPNDPKYMLIQTAGENFQLDQYMQG